MEKIVDLKKATANDEIQLVNHLEKVLKEGLKGTNDREVKGEEPIRRFYSGVLFPDSEYRTQLEEANEDPQPKYKSLAKNCNMGLEFLINPSNSVRNIRVNVSGKFNIYPRFFPTFEEQLKSLDYLENIQDKDLSYENLNHNKNAITRTNRGLKLLEKYEQYNIEFENISFEIDTQKLETLEVTLQNEILKSMELFRSREDFFDVNSDVISKTGTVPLPKKPVSLEEYETLLENMRKGEKNSPNWDAKLVIDPIYYKDKNGQDLIKVTVSLINTTPAPAVKHGEKPSGHSLELFDCSFEVFIEKAEHVPFKFDGTKDDYKYDNTYHVKGINCVGYHKNINKGLILYTESIPSYFQNHYRTREVLSVSFNDLISSEKSEDTLKKVSLEMRKYLYEWESFINDGGNSKLLLDTEEKITKCQADMKEFQEEIESFELGIYVLKRDQKLMSAFNKMNEVFIKSGKGKYTSWRLFQIIYIVRILPSLYLREMTDNDPKYSEIVKSSKFADVLWFPTGGGKTEAYLGLIVTALFYDRLRGKKLGCTAWIRFPLRMLSKNQLDRLAKILIYAEEYRESDLELSSTGVPFSIGFFAGGSNTDNYVSAKKIKKYLENESSKKKKMLLHKCPSCDKGLTLEFDEVAWRFIHRCNNKNCFVVKSEKLKGILPIYITDSEVYRYVPSVLCGTVDKLAILGRYREFSHIFGQIGGRCSKHGFYSDRCIVGAYDEYSSCSEKSNNTAKYKEMIAQYRDKFYDPVPSFFIQDELHLLKEELGALNGHYEGILNEFSRSFGKNDLHLPKIIAATATIESYEHHINHLYLRPPRKYPSMGYILGESFYATSKPKVKRRLYLGVLPHTRSQEEVIGRCIYLYQKEIQHLYLTSKNFDKIFKFEAIRDEAEFKKLLSYYDLTTVYVNQKAMGNDVSRRVEEYKSVNFTLESEILTGENDMDKIIRVIDRIEREGGDREHKDKLHLLIATSLISHGVDLERINCFFMAGMPSKQAEYIQASSRSARTHAGLVLVSFRPNDLRERSQYQFFVQNHEFLDRLVDPVPINRLAIKAVERTLPGLLSGLLLNVHSQNSNNTIYNCGLFQEYIASQVTKGIAIDQVIIDQLYRIYGVNYNYFSLTARQKVSEHIRQLYKEKEHLLNTSSKTMKIKEEQALNPITSFRDIEEGITLQSSIDTDYVLRSAKRINQGSED
ncbi:DEAD/DEAH box helicase [Bacillus subtilis]